MKRDLICLQFLADTKWQTAFFMNSERKAMTKEKVPNVLPDGLILKLLNVISWRKLSARGKTFPVELYDMEGTTCKKGPFERMYIEAAPLLFLLLWIL